MNNTNTVIYNYILGNTKIGDLYYDILCIFYDNLKN